MDGEFFANGSNVPVDIWLTHDEETDTWSLRWACYMPRKAAVWSDDDDLEIKAETREELAAIIRDKIVPMYKAATEQLRKIVAGTEKCLYYWPEPKDKP